MKLTKEKKTIKHRQILSFLTELRNSHPEQVEIFNRGSCLNLFCMLRVLYPEARCYFNVNHVITEINGKYYDINGLVTNIKSFVPFNEVYRGTKRTNRAFTQMYKATHEIIKKEIKKPTR